MTIAVLIPYYNEAKTIAKVVRDYRAALPEADIYVYDNNSTDHTDHRQSLHEFQIQQFSRQCIRCAPDLLVSGNGKRTLLTHPQIQLHIVLGKLLAVRQCRLDQL